MEIAILIAGIGQLLLVIGSLAIPRVLNWKEETSKLKPLTRQVFWTYAGYIWFTNLSIAIISIVSPASLLDSSTLALAVTLYITIYWTARVLIQFLYFDRTDAPTGKIFVLAEVLLVGLFIGLTIVYGCAVYQNGFG